MAISAREIHKLASLARLEITDQEAQDLAPQLENILEFVARLASLDTTGVEPMTSALDVQNRWRRDDPHEGLSRDDALSVAAAADEECFLVPPVLSK